MQTDPNIKQQKCPKMACILNDSFEHNKLHINEQNTNMNTRITVFGNSEITACDLKFNYLV